VSKNATWRIWAWSGSMASAATAERRSASGTLSFSSTPSTPFSSFNTAVTCSAVSDARL
jgi:hypothetical protein